MSSLDKYILRQCVGPLLLILFVTTAIVWMTQSLQRIDIIVEHGQSLGVFMFLSMLIIPSMLAITLPFALFGAIVYALYRLHSDSEIAVMFAAGVSRWRIAAPLLAVAAIIAGATFYVNVDAMPRTYRILKHKVAEIRADIASSLVRSGEFVTIGDGYTIYVDEVHAGGQFSGVMINDYRNGKDKRTYLAERAVIQQTQNGPLLLMRNGNIQKKSSEDGEVDFIRFEDWAVDISSLNGDADKLQLELTERYLGELLKPDLSKAYDRKNRNRLIAEGHSRIAGPLYAIAYAFIGLFSLIGGAYTRRTYFTRVTAAAGVIFALRAAGFAAQAAAGASGAFWLVYAIPLAAIGAAAYLLSVSSHASIFAAKGAA